MMILLRKISVTQKKTSCAKNIECKKIESQIESFRKSPKI